MKIDRPVILGYVFVGVFWLFLLIYWRDSTADASLKLRRLAHAGDAKAQYALGRSYSVGTSNMQNFVAAEFWIHKAADQGYAQAQNELAVFFYLNNNLTEAVRWCKLAAEQNLPEAQFNLGDLYQNGAGIAIDLVEADKWFRLAVAQGFRNASNAVAELEAQMSPDQIQDARRREAEFCFDKGKKAYQGLSCPTNVPEAIKWYERAGNLGMPNAQNDLGVIYVTGQGGVRDFGVAERWLRLAAEQGAPEAQYNLACLYRIKEVSFYDPVEAKLWLSLAATNGFGQAFKEMAAFEQDMTPAQLAESQKRVQQFMTTHQPSK